MGIIAGTAMGGRLASIDALSLIWQASWLVQLVIGLLVLLSIISWAIILHKGLQFRLIGRESGRFLKSYRESRRFSLVASGAKRLRQSPLGRVYLGAYQELSASGAPPDVMDGPPEPGEEPISPDRLESIQRAMRRVHATEVERMEGDVITLQDIFAYDHKAGFDSEGNALGSLKATGLRPKFLEKMQYANVTVDPLLFATGRAV